MVSSEDFQSIYELYKKQGIPNGISIVTFCQHNGIVYSQFERWFKSKKKTAKPSVHPIQLVDTHSFNKPMDADEPSEPEPINSEQKPPV